MQTDCFGFSMDIVLPNPLPESPRTNMMTEKTLLSANADGSLLSAISKTPYEEIEIVAETLSTMHNSGRIDFLRACNSRQLGALSDRALDGFRSVFYSTMPRIDCSPQEAITIVHKASERAQNVIDVLRDWFQQTAQRAERGLELIQSDIAAYSQVVKPVLLAGARHDVRKYAGVALHLARQPMLKCRLDAVISLGVMELAEHEDLYVDAVKCFAKIIDVPVSKHDRATATRAALSLLKSLGTKGVGLIEPLLLKVCEDPTPSTLHEIVLGINSGKCLYTEKMIDATFSAIGSAAQYQTDTIDLIDTLLYKWDIEGDRNRVLALIANILDRDDGAISLRRIHAFSHKIRSSESGLLGWYLVSMLLTGIPRVCRAANDLLSLSYSDDAEDFDIDLSDLSLDGPEILFLCRKIIGYCLSNRSGSAALILSCMRAIPDDLSVDIERTIFDYFLINYPVAIDWFEEHVSTEDPARPMVTRMSNDLQVYLGGIRECGICKAFRPSERQRRLQDYRQMDMWRTIQREAYERSIATYIAQKSTVLYGTGSIYYLYIGDDSVPRRQVSSFASHRQEMEIPRLEVLDPVGIDCAIRLLQSEAPAP